MDFRYLTFELEFTINHPFAYETAQQEVFNIQSGENFTVHTDGTVKTPIRLVIKNTGNQPIRNLVLSARFADN